MPNPREALDIGNSIAVFLSSDTDFIQLVKQAISDFKLDHKDSQCNPNTIWDALKCKITGICMGYGARKKKEKNKEKNDVLKKIDDIQMQMNLDP